MIYWEIANMFNLGISAGKHFTFVTCIISCAVLAIAMRPTAVIQSQGDEAITVDNVTELELVSDDIPGVFIGFFNNDGTKLISSTGTEILIWNVDSAQPPRLEDTIHLELDPEEAILDYGAISPNGTYVAVPTVDSNADAAPAFAAPEYNLRLINLSNREVATLQRFQVGVRDLAFSPQNNLLAAGALSYIQLWNTERAEKDRLIGEQSPGISYHQGEIYSLAFNHDGSLLASGGGYNNFNDIKETTIRLWNMQTDEQVAILEGHSNNVTSLAFSPDDRVLASGSTDNTVRLWDIQTYQEIAVLSHNTWISDLTFNHNGTLLVAAPYLGEIYIWNLASQTRLSEIQDREQYHVINVAFSPDDSLLVTSGIDGSERCIHIYSVRNSD